MITVLKHFCGGELAGLLNLCDLFVSKTYDHVLWLKICVNDLALSVNVVKTNKTLSRQFPHQGNRNTFVVVSLDQFQKIYTQYLEYHNEMLAVRTVVDERIKQLNTVGSDT